MNFSNYSGRWDQSRRVIDAAKLLASVVVSLVVAFTLACACGLMFGGCANTERALQAADRQGAACRADEADVSLPAQARMIAMDDADTFEVIRWHLGGAAPSADAQERINERRKARGEEPLTFQ